VYVRSPKTSCNSWCAHGPFTSWVRFTWRRYWKLLDGDDFSVFVGTTEQHLRNCCADHDQRRSDRGIRVYIPPKLVQVHFLWGKNDAKRLLNMIIKFCTSSKNLIPPKQISGYAPDHDDSLAPMLLLLVLCLLMGWMEEISTWYGTIIIFNFIRRKSWYKKQQIKEMSIIAWVYSVSQKNPPPRFFWHFFANGWEFLIQILHACYTFLSTMDYEFLFNYLHLWRSYAILSATTIICSKCPPSVETHAGGSHSAGAIESWRPPGAQRGPSPGPQRGPCPLPLPLLLPSQGLHSCIWRASQYNCEARV